MNLEIRHLQLVVAITEEKSVTKAAERLFLTQSALSHQLKEIENRLGTELFLRLNKKMILTDAGKTLLKSARKILSDLRATENEIQHIANDKRGSIRFSTECYTCYHWLPPLLKKFNESHPQVEVEIAVDATKQPIDALLDGKLDLAITSYPEKEDKNLDYTFLFEDEMVVAVSPNHALAKRSYIKPKDFEDEHLIIYWNFKESMVYKRILRPAGIEPKRVSRVQLTEAILEMIKADMGIGVLARWAIDSHIKSGAVIAVPLSRAGFKRRWFAATLKRESIPAYIPEFIELIAKSGKPARLLTAA